MSKKRNSMNVIRSQMIGRSYDESLRDYRQSNFKTISYGRTKDLRNDDSVQAIKTNKKFSTISLDQKLEAVFNKNIAKFRDCIVIKDDKSQLPFMSSLRVTPNARVHSEPRETDVKPFDVAFKQTMNQKIKKSMRDINCPQIRLAKAYYRWHNHSGSNTRQVAEFQCTLKQTFYQKKHSAKFDNILRPIPFRAVPQQLYQQQQLICPRQKKIFKIE